MIAKVIPANFSGDNHLKHACTAQECIQSLERMGADCWKFKSKMIIKNVTALLEWLTALFGIFQFCMQLVFWKGWRHVCLMILFSPLLPPPLLQVELHTTYKCIASHQYNIPIVHFSMKTKLHTPWKGKFSCVLNEIFVHSIFIWSNQ